MLRAEWSCSENPGEQPNCFIERAFNIHSMYDSKTDVNDRIQTFESISSMKGDLACCQIDTEVPDIIHTEINDAIAQIRDHLTTECEINLKNGTFYFKYDKKDKLYLIYSAGI